VDSTQEFKVESNNLSAEWGRFSGGVVNVSSRSGTNELHGALYEFLRNSCGGDRNAGHRAALAPHHEQSRKDQERPPDDQPPPDRLERVGNPPPQRADEDCRGRRHDPRQQGQNGGHDQRFDQRREPDQHCERQRAAQREVGLGEVGRGETGNP
jgi:hypothetical protein